MQFRIPEASDFHQTHHIDVFWGAGNEYDDVNTHKFDFQGQTWEKCFQQVFSFYVDKYWSRKKIFSKKVIADEKIYL